MNANSNESLPSRMHKSMRKHPLSPLYRESVWYCYLWANSYLFRFDVEKWSEYWIILEYFWLIELFAQICCTYIWIKFRIVRIVLQLCCPTFDNFVENENEFSFWGNFIWIFGANFHQKIFDDQGKTGVGRNTVDHWQEPPDQTWKEAKQGWLKPVSRTVQDILVKIDASPVIPISLTVVIGGVPISGIMSNCQ